MKLRDRELTRVARKFRLRNDLVERTANRSRSREGLYARLREIASGQRKERRMVLRSQYYGAVAYRNKVSYE